MLQSQSNYTAEPTGKKKLRMPTLPEKVTIVDDWFKKVAW
jgi:hypothetical protein